MQNRRFLDRKHHKATYSKSGPGVGFPTPVAGIPALRAGNPGRGGNSCFRAGPRPRGREMLPSGPIGRPYREASRGRSAKEKREVP